MPTRLLILCEGQTEAVFISEVLKPHFCEIGFQDVFPKLIGGTGGIIGWPKAKKNILKRIQEDRNQVVTTFVDFYGLPKSKGRAWPGRTKAEGQPQSNKADCVESEIWAELNDEFGGNLDPRRFRPFVVMHEFEALLFSDCTAFAKAIEQPSLTKDFESIRNQFPTPEEINDSRETAPSKRIAALLPNYSKPLYGCLAALEIGLKTMRAECQHFDSWITNLETIVQPD